ncbi:MAG: DUF4160 domain-containing protein [Polaromonas sp.]
MRPPRLLSPSTTGPGTIGPRRASSAALPCWLPSPGHSPAALAVRPPSAARSATVEPWHPQWFATARSGCSSFWLAPQVAVATSTGLSTRQLREAQTIVEAHIEEIQNAWNHHFGA